MNFYSVSSYRKLIKSNQRIRRKIYKLEYNYEFKSTPYLWYRLSKNKINKGNIKERMEFREDPLIPLEYRSKNIYYLETGYDKGHLAPDASFDYNLKTLKETYFLSNVIPQKPKLNRQLVKTIEKYERLVTKKLGYLYVVCLNKYEDNKTIKGNVRIPSTMYKILINKKNKFLRIFRYKQSDEGYKIKEHLITVDEFKKDFDI